jgi:hypothetical protein
MNGFAFLITPLSSSRLLVWQEVVWSLIRDYWCHPFCCSVLKLIIFLHFQTLLGIWGPVVVSVGNLLTIVLVLLSDILIGQGVDVITPWNLVGAGGIIAAFGILVYDMAQRSQSHI